VTRRQRALVGWREWVVLPDLSPVPVKAKVDTGALTSALHAEDLRHERTPEGIEVVRFVLLPHQTGEEDAIEVTAPLVDVREVRSSSGEAEERPTVRTRLQLGDVDVAFDVTLTTRDRMGFRMLLGRRALRRRFLVDPGASFLFGDLDRD
jgi:hypothetical protein